MIFAVIQSSKSRAKNFKGLDAVILESSCLKLPAAAFLGLAKTFSELDFALRLIFLKSSISMNTSPLISINLGGSISVTLKDKGMEGMVLILQTEN